jgi:hypothetical protein
MPGHVRQEYAFLILICQKSPARCQIYVRYELTSLCLEHRLCIYTRTNALYFTQIAAISQECHSGICLTNIPSNVKPDILMAMTEDCYLLGGDAV